ncbi:MAG: hypothetical protein ACFE9S_15650 [Candidatus Hermodarchaeota archaeon]
MMIKDNEKYLSSVRKAKNGVYGNLNIKEGFIDCCKEFRFIRAFDTINFNNKMNRLGITHLVLDEGYNFTEVLEVDIIEPIINHSNNVFGIIGKTGSGKSELGQTIALISKKANKDYLNRDVEFYLCYTWEDFHSSLKLLKEGDVLLKDEMPRSVGKNSRTQKWEIENILHSVRKLSNTFIFIDPLDINVDLCDLYIESAGMDFKTKTNRFMLLNERKQYFGHIYVKLHENEQFRDWYETQKDIFIQEILEKAGKIQVKEEDKNIPTQKKNSIENIEDILNNYKSRNKERDIDIYLRVSGEENPSELRKKYGFKDVSSIYKIYNNINNFIRENNFLKISKK